MPSPRAKVEISFWCLQTEGGREGFGTAFAVHGGGNDATGVARTFTAREESGEAHVLQGVVVAHHTNGRRSARFGGDEDRIVGEKTATATTEGFEALLQTLGDEARHPKMEGRGDQAGGVARFGEFGRETVVDKIGHALGGRHLRAPTLHPRGVRYLH